LPAVVRIQALREPELTGKVTRSSWSLDNRSRTLRVEIDLPNPQGQLRPGMYAQVRLTPTLPDRWSLPAATIFMEGDQANCFLLENGVASRTPLRLGIRQGQSVEVLQKYARPPTVSRAGAPKEWQAVTGEETILQGNLGVLRDGEAVPGVVQ
jgi:multidrug efflux pump subunit AcrA (membrane-fusion protein)